MLQFSPQRMMGLAHGLRCHATMRVATRVARTLPIRPVALARPAAPACLRALWSDGPQMSRAGQALAFGGLAASVVEAARCDDDDDDDEPLTPEQQAYADKIAKLEKGAKAVSITPGMAIFLVGGMAGTLGGFIAQGASMPSTLAGLAMSVVVLSSLVAASTKTKTKEVEALEADAKAFKFPALLFATYSAGIVLPAATTIVRTGAPLAVAVPLAASVAITGVMYAAIVSPMKDLAEQSVVA